MTITNKTRKILWGRSGNRCAICKVHLVVDPTEADTESLVGEECHVRSPVEHGPRHQPDYPTNKLDSTENLLLLCRIHHKQVDDQVKTFSVGKLLEIKATHELWVHDKLSPNQGPTRVRWIDANRSKRLNFMQSGGQLLNLVGSAGLRKFSHPEPRSDHEAQLIGDFLQDCHDHSDIWDDIAPRNQVIQGNETTKFLEEFREKGFLVFAARETHELVGGNSPPTPITVVIMQIVRSDDPSISFDRGDGSQKTGELIALYDKLRKQGRRQAKCLHYDANDSCGPTIASHSIQKQRQLRLVAENGHVYQPSFHLSAPGFRMKKVGLREASTFPGFCSTHDQQLFEPIDSEDLVPTDEQIALYAHRCLCREVAVREIVIETARAVHDALGAQDSKDLSASHLGGLLQGMTSLSTHKVHYDASLRSRLYSEFNWISFLCEGPWTHQLSGVLYPDFDWQGSPIQHLGDSSAQLQLLTYFTAPTSTGWSLSLAWHRSSQDVCEHFYRSLATAMYEGMDASDALFRLVACSENQAVRLSWWDGLEQAAREAIEARSTLIASPIELLPPDYLATGLDGISPWTFDAILTSPRLATSSSNSTHSPPSNAST